MTALFESLPPNVQALLGVLLPMRTLRIFTTVTLLIAGQATHARGDGDLWIMLVGPMCLAQFPAYADTDTGKIFLRGSDINAFLDRPFARCFRARQWASTELCAEVMGLQQEQMRDLQTVYEHHRDEIRGMKAAFDYFNAYIAHDPKSPTWPPACPGDLK